MVDDKGNQQSGPLDDEPTPFERFEALVRKVVAVPKAEIDKKRHGPRYRST